MKTATDSMIKWLTIQILLAAESVAFGRAQWNSRAWTAAGYCSRRSRLIFSPRQVICCISFFFRVPWMEVFVLLVMWMELHFDRCT